MLRGRRWFCRICAIEHLFALSSAGDYTTRDQVGITNDSLQSFHRLDACRSRSCRHFASLPMCWSFLPCFVRPGFKSGVNLLVDLSRMLRMPRRPSQSSPGNLLRAFPKTHCVAGNRGTHYEDSRKHAVRPFWNMPWGDPTHIAVIP